MLVPFPILEVRYRCTPRWREFLTSATREILSSTIRAHIFPRILLCITLFLVQLVRWSAALVLTSSLHPGNRSDGLLQICNGQVNWDPILPIPSPVVDPRGRLEIWSHCPPHPKSRINYGEKSEKMLSFTTPLPSITVWFCHCSQRRIQ